MNTFLNTFRYRLKNKEPLIILLAINAFVFLLFTISNIFINLSNGSVWALSLNSYLQQVFFFNTDSYYFLTHPWTLITSIFTHVGLMHILFNMLIFYFAAEMFVYFFGRKKLIPLYLLGGIVGNLLEFAIGLVFQQNASMGIIGASGSVMAVFMAVAIFKPDFNVKLFGVFDVKIIYLAAFYFLLDFVNLGANDGIAHFAHIGGAIIGVIVARQQRNSNDILDHLLALSKKFSPSYSKGYMKKPIRNTKPVSDDDYNLRKKEQQEKTDAILDKISKYGYDALTAEEKAFLFDQSHKK